jgi:hypothetical protein
MTLIGKAQIAAAAGSHQEEGREAPVRSQAQYVTSKEAQGTARAREGNSIWSLCSEA